MFTSDYRMVQGQPLHYYPPYGGLDRDPFPYFCRFESYRPQAMEMPDDMILPSSPNSIQSDSDNSVSSVEISPTPIRSQNSIIKIAEKSEVQCRWRSCGIHFASLDQLATHVAKVHSASGVGGLFYCGWEGCTRNDKGFNARYKMLVHVRTHTNEKPHKCFQCDKSFSRAENLKIHSRSHSGEKPYVCPVPGCNKAYSNSSDRFKHTRTHQVDKPYQCKVPGCSKRYTDPSSLRKHVKTYKHFVNDGLDKNQKPVEAVKEVSMIDDRAIKVPSAQIYRENVIRHPCNCNRMCCVSNCLNNTADLFRIGALLNLKQEETNWNGYVDSYITESTFAPYEVRREETVDFDAPLDLSVHRRDF